MIQDTSFIVVDLETTGLEPSLDRVIEIGAVKVKNGKIVKEWGTLVNPGIFIPLGKKRRKINMLGSDHEKVSYRSSLSNYCRNFPSYSLVQGPSIRISCQNAALFT